MKLKKWWLLQHIADPSKKWIPAKVITIFGFPLATMFFRAIGPFKSREHAELRAALENPAAVYQPETSVEHEIYQQH